MPALLTAWSPRERGWTGYSSLTDTPRFGGPRASGGGPRAERRAPQSRLWSPRERGWTRRLERVRAHKDVVPARAGVDPC